MPTVTNQARIVVAITGATPAATEASAAGVAIDHDALTPIREGNVVLKSGAQGAAVREIQRLLGVKSDGDYGPLTERAVRKFQQDHALKTDGKVGRQTLAALEQDRLAVVPQPHTSSTVGTLAVPRATPEEPDLRPTRNYPTLRQGDQGQIVLSLKRQLNLLDCEPRLNENNPVFDSATVQAVRDFQASALKDYPHLKRTGDKPTGVVTPTTWHWIEVALETQNTPLNKLRKQVGEYFAPDNVSRKPATEETFNRALAFTLGAEGGKSSDPDDRGNRGGNVTVCGVTQPSLNYYCKVTGIKPIDMRKERLSSETIHDFYRTLYWKPVNNLKLPECLAISYFDCGVLFGPQAAKCMLADALGFPPDGKLSQAALERLRGEDPAAITRRLNACADTYVTKICERRPRNEKFEAGWRLRTERRDIASGVAPSPRAPLISLAPREELAPIGSREMHELVAAVQLNDPQLKAAPTGEGDAKFYRRLMGR